MNLLLFFLDKLDNVYIEAKDDFNWLVAEIKSIDFEIYHGYSLR